MKKLTSLLYALAMCLCLSLDFAGYGILTQAFEGDRALKITGLLAKYSGALFFSHLYPSVVVL